MDPVPCPEVRQPAHRDQALAAAMTRLELTDEERRALILLIEAALHNPKYPLSPEVEALRAVAEKLRGEARKERNG
jgi:hypothetical protein